MRRGGENMKVRRRSGRFSRSLGGGLRFGFFTGPGEELGRRRRRCPLRERLREKEKIDLIVWRKSACCIRHVLLSLFCCVADSGFGSVVGWVFRSVVIYGVTCVEAREVNGR